MFIIFISIKINIIKFNMFNLSVYKLVIIYNNVKREIYGKRNNF